MFDCDTQKLVKPLACTWQRLFSPLLRQLDQHMDCRLVATLAQTVRAIIEHRHGNHGLLLSELGAYLLSPQQAPAGTKRLSNLLRSPNWQAQHLADYLWQQAQQQVQEAVQDQQEMLVLWDESALEKPESQAAQGLCPVRSSKAARLSRIKPGYYRKPGAPVFVPGLHWMALLFIGRSGPPQMAAMRWWGTRSQNHNNPGNNINPNAESTRESIREPWMQTRASVKSQLLGQCQESFGALVLHVFDRGFAGGPWLEELS